MFRLPGEGGLPADDGLRGKVADIDLELVSTWRELPGGRVALPSIVDEYC